MDISNFAPWYSVLGCPFGPVFMGRHGEEILFDGLYLKYSVSFGGSLGGLSWKN